jgi:RNA:NAD 2'-phosphotransferase (TPT1/KptA family)
LSSSIRTAAEAGKVHYNLPTILEVDTARMVADGETIWHAGITVYLVESVDGGYLTTIANDNPEYEVARARWVEEEE